MSSNLYIIDKSPRGQIVADLAQYLKLDVNVVTDRESDATYTKNFPLKKIPAFIGKNGFKLTEVIAISYYRMFDFFFLFYVMLFVWWETFYY